MKLLYARRGNFGGSKAVYALLEYLVALEYGIPMPEVRKHSTGKPYFPERPDIHFSLSHTKTHVLCAVSDSPVGVDIETVRSIRPGVPERVCTPSELLIFDFFDLWVLKESFIKLSGNTNTPLKSICFSRAGEAIIAQDLRVRSRHYDTVPGCAAAVCSLDDDITEAIEMADLSKILRSY